ncbi:MAG TPA: DUF6531 domain-containing protein, partial [Pyrinomonadaceae bacterium]|nr:DUF6531 domain-containing protein [Pyrinomonadaceae bacterium]
MNEAALARIFAPSSTPTLIKEKRGACLPCATARGNSETDPVDSPAALGRRTQIHPLRPLERSLFDGTMVNFVSTSTGHLAFAITDLEITGEMPILFQRAYSSDNGEDRGLGAGWSFVFDDRITLGRDGATLSTGMGSVINFQREGQSQRFILKTDEPNVHQAFDILDANTIVERAGGLARTYKRLGQTYHLQQIADPDGNTITLSFNSREKVSRIAGSGTAALTLEWSDEKDPRLLAVADQSHHRVAFEQEGRRLRRVTDAAGAQWAYDYQGGRLVRALDPAGRVLLRARYDRAGRVVEAGDGAGTNLYEYESAANDYARRTVVTGPEGAKATFEQTERGSLSAIRDDEGEAVLGIDYNSANRPTRIVDRENGDTVFSYDAQNRLVNRASSDGSFQTYTYDERGQVSSTTTNAGRTDYERDERGDLSRAKSNGPAQSYRVTRNSRGQAISVKSEAGSEISFEYDAAGNASAFSTNRAGRFETGTDANGRVISRSLPSGALYRYEYDPRGMLLKQSDNRGHAVTFEREASGALTGVLMASGKWIRATRDEAGRIVTLSTSAGKSRRFAYDARGALTDYTDARGRRKHFSYDRRGRLESVEDDDGHHTVVERDLKGRVKRVWSFNLPKGKPDFRDAR